MQSIKEATFDDLSRAANRLQLTPLVCLSPQVLLEARRGLTRHGSLAYAIQTSCMPVFFSFHITRKQFEDTTLQKRLIRFLCLISSGTRKSTRQMVFFMRFIPLFYLRWWFSCPPSRYVIFCWVFSKRLDRVAAHALGTDEVSGLSIDEGQREKKYHQICATSLLLQKKMSALSCRIPQLYWSLRCEQRENAWFRFIKGTCRRWLSRLFQKNLLTEAFFLGGHYAQRRISEKNYQDGATPEALELWRK